MRKLSVQEGYVGDSCRGRMGVQAVDSAQEAEAAERLSTQHRGHKTDHEGGPGALTPPGLQSVQL